MATGLSPNVFASLILALVVLLLIWLAVLYNRLVQSRNRVKEAWSGVDVQLRRRASLVPNVVETVKGYADHEREVFEEVSRARSALQRAGGARDASSANNMVTQALSHLFAVVENYPQLRASDNFKDLHRELTDVEEKIAYARQFYNRNVLDYNTRIQTFPGIMIARNAGFEPCEFFEAPEEAQGEVRVSFARSTPGAASPTEPPKEPQST